MNTSCSAVCDILDSTPSLKSRVSLPVSYARVTLCSVQYHDPHKCFHGRGACALLVLMAATDDELQKLGRPPIYSGKEDEWNEWSFVMRSYVSLLSAHIPALLAGAEDTASPDMSMARIKDTLFGLWHYSSPETLPRLGDERERTSIDGDQKNRRRDTHRTQRREYKVS